jgi:putative Holliday junction resolvase
MRYLGVDPGAVRIGLALSDAEGRLALPLTTLQRDDSGAWRAQLAALVAEREVEAVVVGMPLSLSGERGPAAQQTEEFVAALSELLPVPVLTWDERLTSAQVERSAQAAGLSERDRRGRLDAAAASLILQNYLDAHAET